MQAERDKGTKRQRHKGTKSWHHRIARLIGDSYSPSCQAGKCPKPQGIARAALFICEWDQMQGNKVVSRRKLYCREHAEHFAQRHSISMTIPLHAVPISQLETASRDDWAYSQGDD